MQACQTSAISWNSVLAPIFIETPRSSLSPNPLSAPVSGLVVKTSKLRLESYNTKLLDRIKQSRRLLKDKPHRSHLIAVSKGTEMLTFDHGYWLSAITGMAFVNIFRASQ